MRGLILSLVFLFSTAVYAESSTKEQKINFAYKALQNIVTPSGYTVVDGSVKLRGSYRADFHSVSKLTEWLGSENELHVLVFILEKDNELFQGWTYLHSVNLDPVTPINAFGFENGTAEYVEAPTEFREEYPSLSDKTELTLHKTVWSLNAPAVSDLHIESWK